jgi:hypothetical protein
MTNQMTVSADSMAYGPREYFWARDVKADLSMPVKPVLTRIQPGQQAVKGAQC